MSAIDSMTAGKALGLGFLLSAVNPKNLLMAISAGLIVGGADLAVGQISVVIIIFVLLAASTVLIPVVGYVIAAARLAGSAREVAGMAGRQQCRDYGRAASGHWRLHDRQRLANF